MTTNNNEDELYRVQKGNYAAAYGAMDAGVQVVTAYPITPQTTVVEKLSELVGQPEFTSRGQNVEFIWMESEHSVMGGLVGASVAGARTFTATSGQGLLYMAEMVHWAAGTRLPLVMTVASRGIAPPWNIWADFSDVISMRDTGCLIQLLSTHQEVYDSVIMGYAVAEHPDVLLPLIPAYGGFTISHTSKPVKRIPWEDVQKFIPPVPEKGWPHIWIDHERPMMHGNLIMPQSYYTEFRAKIEEAQINAKSRIKAVAAEFKRRFGRDYGNGLVQHYKTEDADVVLICAGELARQAEDAVDQLRKEGYKVGVLRLRTYRPFPTEDIVELAKRVKYIGVVDRATAFGSPTAGPISTDVMASVFRDPASKDAYVIPFIAGLGGRDVTIDEQKEQFKRLITLKETGKAPETKDLLFGTYWTGLLKK